MSETTTPATTPATPAPAPATTTAPAAPPQTPPTAPTEPFAVFPTQAAFHERVDREARSRLKEMGIEDPTKVQEILAEHTALKQDAEKRRQEQLTELEREREARTKAEADLAAERAQREAAAERATMFKLFGEHGVKNYDFASFALSKARAEAPDPSKFDAAAHLTAMKADPASAAALGIASVSTVPATTTDSARETPPAGSAPPTTKRPQDMTPEEFRAHVERTTGYSMR